MKLVEINAHSIAQYGEQSCAMESLFSEALALDTPEKMGMLCASSGLFLVNSFGLVGECMGALADAAYDLDNEIPDLAPYFGKWAFYVYSTSIASIYQGAGWGKVLRYAMQGYVMGMSRVKKAMDGYGFKYVIGHAREGAMLYTVEQMGARIVRSHENYFNAGYRAYFYEFDLSGNKTDD